MKKRVRDELKPGEKRWENRDLEEKLQAIIKYRWKTLVLIILLNIIPCLICALICNDWFLFGIQMALLGMIILGIINLYLGSGGHPIIFELTCCILIFLGSFIYYFI